MTNPLNWLYLGSSPWTWTARVCMLSLVLLCNAMDCSLSGSSIHGIFQARVLTISWSLLKFMSFESLMLSDHLTLCGPLFLHPSIFHNIRVFSNESALRIRWPKCWSFSFNRSDQISHSVVSDSVQLHRQQSTRLPCPWDSPGKNTGVGCHFLLQGSNLCLLHYRQILYHWAIREALNWLYLKEKKFFLRRALILNNCHINTYGKTNLRKGQEDA